MGTGTGIRAPSAGPVLRFHTDPRLAVRQALRLGGAMALLEALLGFAFVGVLPVHGGILAAAAAGAALLVAGGTWGSLRWLGVRWIETSPEGLLVRRRGRTLRLRWENVGWARRFPGTFGGRWEFGLPGGREFSLPLEGVHARDRDLLERALRTLLGDRIRKDGFPDGLLGVVDVPFPPLP